MNVEPIDGDTSQLKLSIPQPMEVCETQQIAIVSNNIVSIPVQQIQQGETLILSQTVPNYSLSQLATNSQIIFNPEDFGMSEETILVNGAIDHEGENSDVKDDLNGSTTLLRVLTPDGLAREIRFSHPVEKLNLPRILYQVCRHVGLDDTMEGHMDCESEEIRVQRREQIQELFKRCAEEEKSEPLESDEEENSENTKNIEEPPLNRNGTIICSQYGFASPAFIQQDQRCKGAILKTNNKVSLDSESKKKKCSRKHKKLVDEPVCLTISSDEEDGEITKTPSASNGEYQPEESILNSIKDKEPIITEHTEAPYQTRIEGGGVDVTELLDSPGLEKALLQCRTVRIGSYKVVPEEKVTLSEYGLKFKVPALNGDVTVIKILRTDIVKVLVHFGKQMPVIFYYTTNSAGIKVRNALQMPHKPDTTYFDPTSTIEMHRRITLLPDKIPEDTRLFIKSVYDSQCLLDELSAKEANDILVRAVPQEVQTHLRKDNYQSSATTPTTMPKIQTIMVYPPPPAKGGISINTEDYACLGEDQFLNDVIIDFYLKWLVLTKLTPEEQKRTHVFSSFFYKRLTTKTRPTSGLNKHLDDPKLSPAEKRHSRVKGWTKSVDLFSKDFIIIPINENSHWFLGIICYPGLTGCVRMSDNIPVNVPPRRINKSTSFSGPIPAMIGATTITMVHNEPTITVEGEDEERDEAEADDDDLEPNTSDDEAKETQDGELMDEATPRLTKPGVKLEVDEPIKQPCILVFDSLAGASRSRVCATLREYLQVEYSLKHKGRKRDFSKDTIKGAVPKVPQQTNYTDCGLYVLQYVETFFHKPITNFKMPIKMLKDWFTTETVSRKRYDIQQLLHKLMGEQNVDIMRLNLPHLGLHPDGTSSSLLNCSDDDGEEEGDDECDMAMDDGEIDENEMGMDDGELDEEDEHLEEEEDMDDEDLDEVELSRELLRRELIEKKEDKFEFRIPPSNDQRKRSPFHLLSKKDEITVSNAISIKRKVPLSLKEVRNPRLIRQSNSTPDGNKKMRCD